MSAAQLFERDDEYLAWAKDNPTGYVLNVNRSLSGRYLILHSAACGTILEGKYAAGALTERNYRKVAAATEKDLLKWIKSHVPESDGFTRRCSRCAP